MNDMETIEVKMEGLDKSHVQVILTGLGMELSAIATINEDGGVEFTWSNPPKGFGMEMAALAINIAERQGALKSEQVLEAAETASRLTGSSLMEHNVMTNLFRVTDRHAYELLVDKFVTEHTDELVVSEEYDDYVGFNGPGLPYYDDGEESENPKVDEFMKDLAKLVHPDDEAIVTIVSHKGTRAVMSEVYLLKKGKVYHADMMMAPMEEID